MKSLKNIIYISLFAILYFIVAFSSFFHAVSFFGLANNSWMSVILALAFEVGQAAVLFSLLTSKKDRSRVMPWVLMFMFTLVQVIGNVFSSYKYIVTNSIDNLRYFKEPIFIWTSIPDDQATVIIVYLVGALLPIAALLLTSMITNYLSDIDDEKINLISESIEKGPENSPIILDNKEDFNKVYNDDNIDSNTSNNINMDNDEKESDHIEDKPQNDNIEDKPQNNNIEDKPQNNNIEDKHQNDENINNNKSSHFINL